jgi:hypothetical protein
MRMMGTVGWMRGVLVAASHRHAGFAIEKGLPAILRKNIIPA